MKEHVIKVRYTAESYIHIEEIEGKVRMKWSKIKDRGTWWVKHDSIHIRLNDKVTSIPLHAGSDLAFKWPEHLVIADEEGQPLEEMEY